VKVLRGTTRTVVLTKKYAIKVPRLKKFKNCDTSMRDRLWGFCRGILANQSEAEFSKYANSSYSTPQVVPVLKSYLGGIINIYPRVRVEWIEDRLDDLYDKIKFKAPSDVHIGNLGYYNDYPVWVDYDQNWNDCRRCNKTYENARA
jgi:hypothetical protein